MPVSYLLSVSFFQYIKLQLYSFNGLFSNTTWVSLHQKGKPFLILIKQLQEMIGVAVASVNVGRMLAYLCLMLADQRVTKGTGFHAMNLDLLSM